MSSPPKEYQYDVFISHAGEDTFWCKKLATRLKNAGLKPWIDVWHVKENTDVTKGINDGLANSRNFVPVMTKVYFTKEWVDSELTYATNRHSGKARRKFIIPVLRDDCIDLIPPLLQDVVRIDFRNNREFNEKCQELIERLVKAKNEGSFIGDDGGVPTPRRKRKLWIWGALLVLAGVISVIAYFNFGHKPSSPNDPRLKPTLAIPDTTKSLVSTTPDSVPASVIKRVITTFVGPPPDGGGGGGTDPEPLPPPQFVDVNLIYGSDAPGLLRSYGNHAGKVLAYMNGRTFEQITRDQILKNYITDTAKSDLARLLQDYKMTVAANPCTSVICTNNEFLEVRPIPVLLSRGTQASGGTPLHIVLGFDKASPPKLAYVEYDKLANLIHITRDELPLAKDRDECKRLNDFFKRIEAYYNAKQIANLRSTYVDTAEIIVGRQKNSGVQLQKRDKETYFTNLQRVFSSTPELNVQFSDFMFKRIPGNRSRYIAEFYQRWTTNEYSDHGRLYVCVEVDVRDNTYIISREWSPGGPKLENYPISQPIESEQD